jgi:hypothetical protein
LEILEIKYETARYDGYNRKGLNVVHLGVRGYGGGGVDLRDRNGRMYVK